MKKVIEYKVVSNGTSHRLEEEVNRMLKEGWELYGNLCTHDGGGTFGTVLSQALVMYDKKDDKTNV
jgi:hypothetical protein